MPESSLRIVYGAVAARESVLRRVPLEDAEPPDSVRARDRAVFGHGLTVAEVTDRILAAVRTEGDAALKRFNRELDGATPGPIAVSRDEIEHAYTLVEPELVDAMRLAAERIRDFHERQLRVSWSPFEADGLGQVIRPIQRAGIYVAGTAAPLPSSLLMTAVPARVAGVDEVYVASPALPDGSVSPLKLVAADIAGVDAVYRAGGAHGIAALAYGTETVPRVDKVFGPGGLWVTLAKKRVFGVVGVDNIYGPTETMVIGDERADPELCAADLLAQAEHDPLASPILLTDSAALAEQVMAEIARQLASLPREAIAARALATNGGIVVTSSIDEAIDLANEYAPEHLCLLVDDAAGWIPRIRNAGGIFVGEASPEALGDYIAGPSHVMPTGGSARWASPLSVNDFLKVVNVVAVPEAVTRGLAPAAARIAHAEGLAGHARALEIRMGR